MPVPWRSTATRLMPLLAALVLLSALAIAAAGASAPDGPVGQKGKRRSGLVLGESLHVPGAAVAAAARPPRGFAPQARLGFTSGDQWEPAIAADRFGHVYVLSPQYLGVPGCPACPSPTMILTVSDDGGTTWSAPRLIADPGSGQWDPQIVVDPVDGRTVYAAWLQNGKSDIAVARSTDFGRTWSIAIADHTNAGTDKPILAVHGNDVHIAYNHAQKVWVSSSHDGGRTFTSIPIRDNGKLGWSLASGGVVTPGGAVHFSWAGYEQNGNAKGPVNLWISSSEDGGATWRHQVVDVSAAPPDCSSAFCGWAYLGAQIVVDADAAGVLYALWNAGNVDRGPERIWFARSTDNGRTWSARQEVSTAPGGTHHAFPALVAGAAGDVRIGWMDARAGGWWNTWYRSSTNGGQSWTQETDISSAVPGYSYIQPQGFQFPFGDYWELAIDGAGVTHAVFGEGEDYDSPGSIWYTRGR